MSRIKIDTILPSRSFSVVAETPKQAVVMRMWKEHLAYVMAPRPGRGSELLTLGRRIV